MREQESVKLLKDIESATSMVNESKRNLESKRNELEALKLKTKKYIEKLQQEAKVLKDDNRQLVGFLEKRKVECNELKAALELARVANRALYILEIPRQPQCPSGRTEPHTAVRTRGRQGCVLLFERRRSALSIWIASWPNPKPRSTI